MRHGKGDPGRQTPLGRDKHAMNKDVPNRQWTEQECKDAGLLAGLTEQEASLYFLRYESRGWKDGTGNAITNISTHMRLLKMTGGLPKLAEEEKGKQLYPLKGRDAGRVCECGVLAVIKVSGAYDHWYCTKHLPKRTRENLREQGYDV